MEGIVIIIFHILGIIVVVALLIAMVRYSFIDREEEQKKIKRDREAVVALYGKYKRKIDDKTFLYETFLVHDKKKFDFSDIKDVTYSNHCNTDHGGEDYYVQVHFKKNDTPVIFLHAGSLNSAVSLAERIKHLQNTL